jgi:hypothetical protein
VRDPHVALVVPSAARRGGGDVWLAQLLQTLTPCQVDLLVVFETAGELADLASDTGHRVAVLGRTCPASDADLTGLAEPLARVLAHEEPQATVHWSPRAHVPTCTGLGLADWRAGKDRSPGCST